MNVWTKLVAAAMLIGLVSCHSPQNSSKIAGGSDPIEGRFAVIGLGITDVPGALHAAADGRGYTFSLVEVKNADGSKKYYVTNGKNGEWNATSFFVPAPLSPFTFSIVFRGSSRIVSMLTTTGVGIPFEAASLPLRDTESVVSKVVKSEGAHGRGSALLKVVPGGELAQGYTSDTLLPYLLLNVSQGPSGQDVQSVIRAAEMVLTTNGRPLYLHDHFGPDRQYMELTSQTTGAFGVWNPSGPSAGETGRLFEAL